MTAEELFDKIHELEAEYFMKRYSMRYFTVTREAIIKLLEENSNLVEPVVKQAACGKWQRKKPDKPCYFLHRYNKKDDHPSLFDAYIDTDVLCVANIQDDEFVETMEGFADGQFYIIEK